MALNFTPSSGNTTAVSSVTTTESIESTANSIESTIVVDPVEQAESAVLAAAADIKTQLANSKEVDELVSKINVNDTNSIVKFGSEVAEEIAKASDQVLGSMNMSQIDESSAMLTELSKVMEQFDAKDLEEKKGFFANLRKQLDKILAKYDDMGKHIDRIYIELKRYEDEIGQSNRNLEAMYTANINYYKQLQVYIMAGEQACRELDGYIEEYKAKVSANPDSGTTAMDLQNLENVRSIMEQRVMDLKISENVAMQSIPMLKTMEFSNVNLIRKINSAFIITMPIFKQALAQAVMLKRQKIQADAMKALDEKTNELLIKNANNTVVQSKLIAQMANGNSIQIETLEKTWNTIVNGIEETKRIQDEARSRRAEDSKRLEALKNDYKAKMS